MYPARQGIGQVQVAIYPTRQIIIVKILVVFGLKEISWSMKKEIGTSPNTFWFGCRKTKPDVDLEGEINEDERIIILVGQVEQVEIRRHQHCFSRCWQYTDFIFISKQEALDHAKIPNEMVIFCAPSTKAKSNYVRFNS